MAVRKKKGIFSRNNSTKEFSYYIFGIKDMLPFVLRQLNWIYGLSRVESKVGPELVNI